MREARQPKALPIGLQLRKADHLPRLSSQAPNLQVGCSNPGAPRSSCLRRTLAESAHTLLKADEAWCLAKPPELAGLFPQPGPHSVAVGVSPRAAASSPPTPPPNSASTNPCKEFSESYPPPSSVEAETTFFFQASFSGNLTFAVIKGNGNTQAFMSVELTHSLVR